MLSITVAPSLIFENAGVEKFQKILFVLFYVLVVQLTDLLERNESHNLKFC